MPKLAPLLIAFLSTAPLLAQSGPAAGKLLIAEKHLLDPNFSRTVVLLLEHEDGASLGLVINRPTSFRVARLLPQVEAMEERQERIFIGGPVGAEQVWVLSERAVEGGREIVPGVWSTTSSVDLDELAADEGSRFRVFGGYAGWGPGQLQGEIDRGDWRVLPATAARVFDETPETLWTRLYEKAAVRFAFAGQVAPPGDTEGRGTLRARGTLKVGADDRRRNREARLRRGRSGPRRRAHGHGAVHAARRTADGRDPA